MEDDQPPYRAGELLQTAAVVAAIALALSTLMEKRGPDIDGYFLIPLTLLFTGFLAVVGSGYAMSALWVETDLTRRDLSPFRFHTPHSGALIVTTWGLIALGVAYFWILVDGVP